MAKKTEPAIDCQRKAAIDRQLMQLLLNAVDDDFDLAVHPWRNAVAEWAEELENNVVKFTQDVIAHHGRDAGRA